MFTPCTHEEGKRRVSVFPLSFFFFASNKLSLHVPVSWAKYIASLHRLMSVLRRTLIDLLYIHCFLSILSGRHGDFSNTKRKKSRGPFVNTCKETHEEVRKFQSTKETIYPPTHPLIRSNVLLEETPAAFKILRPLFEISL